MLFKYPYLGLNDDKVNFLLQLWYHGLKYIWGLCGFNRGSARAQAHSIDPVPRLGKVYFNSRDVTFVSNYTGFCLRPIPEEKKNKKNPRSDSGDMTYNSYRIWFRYTSQGRISETKWSVININAGASSRTWCRLCFKIERRTRQCRIIG